MQLKIAILLPENAGTGWRWRAQKLAAALLREKCPTGRPIEVAIGLPRTDETTWRRQEAELLEGAPGAVVRHLGWERAPIDMAQRMFPDCRFELEMVPDCALPRDWGWNFVDCDAWIVFAASGQGAVFHIKPTAYYVQDLAERYVPQAFAPDVHSIYWVRQAHAFRSMRQARAVFVSDASTADDVSGYAGVRRSRILQTPQLLPPFTQKRRAPNSERQTLLWLVEPNAQHDLVNALEGLRIYQAEGGTFDVIVAGEGAYAFDPIEGQLALADVPTRSRRPTTTMQFETISGEADLQRVIARSDFIWSSALAQAENDGLLRAAAAELPFIGLRYPQNEHLADNLGVPSVLYDRSEATLIADALATAEQEGAPALPRRSASTKDESDGWRPLIESLWGGGIA